MFGVSRQIALDRELKATGSKHVLYDYNAEGNKFFRVRLKDFFPLAQTRNILSEKFKKSLTHECDGLIFQVSINSCSVWLHERGC